jgi:ubiquinone/menaquinone biosynthesis C-methylase UbiE
MEQKEVYWSRFADDFEEKNNYVIGKQDMDIVLAKVSELEDLGETLELACGNGTYSKVICKCANRLTATDFSEKMVEAATNRLNEHKNIVVEWANAFDLSYPDECFDTVFLANLLHIVSEPVAIIGEVHRVLKKGGRVVILDFGSEGMTFFNKLGLFARYLKSYGKPPATGIKLTRKDIKQFLEQTGFRIVNLELIGNRSKAAYVIAEKV